MFMARYLCERILVVWTSVVYFVMMRPFSNGGEDNGVDFFLTGKKCIWLCFIEVVE